LLIWIYVAWIIVLLGAVIAASLPNLRSAIVLRPRVPGLNFQLALETLKALDQARSGVARGLTPAELAVPLRVAVARLEPVLATLRELDWVAALEEKKEGAEPRLVLLVDPDATPLAPLLHALLLRREPSTENLWQIGRLPALLLRDVL
jgi:membrane protein